MTTAIFYASNTGNTKSVAKEIAKHLGIRDIFDIADIDITIMNNYDKLIIGASTWGEGDLQDDWENKWSTFCKIDFVNKTVALFGLGDQEQYYDNYLDAMGIIYETIVKNGAIVVGKWPANEYLHENSKAILDDDFFVGLAIDEDNEADLTATRVASWCVQIKNEIL